MKKGSIWSNSPSLTDGVTATNSARSTRARGTRKISSIINFALGSSKREKCITDEGQLEGKIKISSTLKNSDTCLSVRYRSDGRYYAVALASGEVNVYSTKTDNIIYQLNNDDKNMPFNDVSATCVRFRPSPILQESEGSSSFLLSSMGGSDTRRRSSASATTDSDHFLPPIVSPKCLSKQSRQYFQRRKSSVSALGIRSKELGLLSPAPPEKSSCFNNLVTASFTNGEIKTFNFMTECCTSVIKENRETLTMGFNKTGSMLATGGSKGEIHVYDDETKTIKCSYTPPFEYNSDLLRTYSIAFHPESEFELISAGWSRYIQFFDARVPNMFVTKCAAPKVIGEGLSFHPSGGEICAAAWEKDEGIHIYDYCMRQPLEKISSKDSVNSSKIQMNKNTSTKPQAMPSSCLYSAEYFLDNFIVVGGAYPGSVAVIERRADGNVNVLSSVKNLTKSVYCVDTLRQNICFIVGNEVSSAEIYL